MGTSGSSRPAIHKQGQKPTPLIRLARFREQRELGLGVAAGVGEPCRIVAGKAMIGILRPRRITAFLAQRPVDALDRQKGEAIATDIGAHLVKPAVQIGSETLSRGVILCAKVLAGINVLWTILGTNGS